MHTSKILHIKKETHDTVSLRFERPDNFNYTPGQYCIFEMKKNEEIIRRSYSLSSSPTEDFLQITVKHVPNGKMSTYLHERKINDVLNFIGPVGKFVFEDELHDVVFVAGGSGISPFRGMTKYIFDKKLKTKIILIYGSRTPHDIIMVDELNEFLKDHPNYKLYLTVDHPDESWNFHTGFIDSNFLQEATKNKVKNKVYFLIGPPPMVTGVKNALLDLGVEEDNIRMDAWG